MLEANLGEAVRRLRQRNGLSLRTLAERTDFSPSFISQVENGQASPSIASMEKIGLALGVTLGEFFRSFENQVPMVVKAMDRRSLNFDWSKAKIEALGQMAIGGKLEAVMITLSADGTSGKRPTAQPNEEFILVVAGKVLLELGTEAAQLLENGDAVSIRPGVPRKWSNPGPLDAQILVVTARSLAYTPSPSRRVDVVDEEQI